MLYIIIGLILLALVWSMVVFNTLIRLHTEASEALSLIDTFLKKRYDLIPNLVTIAKEYASHEQEVFIKVAELRSHSSQAATPQEIMASGVLLSQALISFFGVVEAYPELMANQQFRRLALSLISIEKDLTKSRRYYNGVVREYTSLSRQFPHLIIAHLFQFQALSFFETTDTALPSISL